MKTIHLEKKKKWLRMRSQIKWENTMIRRRRKRKLKKGRDEIRVG